MRSSRNMPHIYSRTLTTVNDGIGGCLSNDKWEIARAPTVLGGRRSRSPEPFGTANDSGPTTAPVFNFDAPSPQPQPPSPQPQPLPVFNFDAPSPRATTPLPNQHKCMLCGEPADLRC